jgi:hypothetical protein
MAFKNKKDAQAAYDAASREVLAYHHALVASMKSELKRVGSFTEKGDTYTWLIAFTPVYHAVIIIEQFKSKPNPDTHTRVFWLDDWKSPPFYGFKWDSLYQEARKLERRKLGLVRSPAPASDVAALIADVQTEFECDYSTALVLANCD